MGGAICDTPLQRRRWLFLTTRQAEQLAIAAVHQREPRFDKANCPIAQIVGLPGSLGDAFRSEQAFGKCSIGGAVASAVESAKREHEPFSPLRRKAMERWSRGTPVERAPKAVRSMRTDVEVSIEW